MVTEIAGADPARLPTPHALLATAARIPNAPAYFVRHTAVWQPTCWSSLLSEVQRAARALVGLGVERGRPSASSASTAPSGW